MNDMKKKQIDRLEPSQRREKRCKGKVEEKAEEKALLKREGLS